MQCLVEKHYIQSSRPCIFLPCPNEAVIVFPFYVARFKSHVQLSWISLQVCDFKNHLKKRGKERSVFCPCWFFWSSHLSKPAGFPSMMRNTRVVVGIQCPASDYTVRKLGACGQFLSLLWASLLNGTNNDSVSSLEMMHIKCLAQCRTSNSLSVNGICCY